MKNNYLSLSIFTSLILFSKTIFFSQCNPGTSVSILDENNVSSYHATNGILWNNAAASIPGYEIPKGTGLYTIYAGSLWIGGMDINNQLHLAADTYGGNGNDFWPGPIDETTFSAYNCQEFDQIWSISKSEIDNFLSNGITSTNITNWPGRNNPNLSFLPLNQELAPFVDNNNDGDYDPADGDYPSFKGDFAQWWVLNDLGNTHGSFGDPLGIELHFMAYVFQTNDAINNTTFYDLEIINKTTTNYNNTYIGLYVDPDLGNFSDDYIGCDTSYNMGFVYNGDDNDETGFGLLGYGNFPPIQGITMVDLPKIGNQTRSMHTFIGYSSNSGSAMNDPTQPIDYYNYMQGIWKDSTQMVYGGNGYVSSTNTQPTTYQFPGSPSDPNGWSECTEGNPPGDRRFVMSFGDFSLDYNDKISMTFATVYHRPSSGTNCESINGLINVVDEVHTFYNNVSNISTSELKETTMGLFPNPANELISLSELPMNSDITIYNMLGEIIYNKHTSDPNITISTTQYKNGVYQIKIASSTTNKTFKLLIKH